MNTHLPQSMLSDARPKSIDACRKLQSVLHKHAGAEHATLYMLRKWLFQGACDQKVEHTAYWEHGLPTGRP